MEKREYREIDIPSLIRFVREKEGMTQKEFAETFGFKESSPSMWELGEREAPYKILGFVFSRWLDKELDKAREEGKREVFSQEELKILMWLVRDRKQGIDWNYKTKRISEWDKLVSDGLFNKLEGLSKLNK